MIIECGNCGKRGEARTVVEMARYQCQFCDTTNEILDISIREWIDFDYSDYVLSVIQAVKDDTFDFLKAYTEADLLRGKLSPSQIDSLKSALIDTFQGGKSIRYLVDRIRTDVSPGSLDVYKEDELIMTIPAEVREISIARTEATRTANVGAANYYKDNGIQKYEWLAAYSARTCDVCSSLNGKVFELGAETMPPAHSMCRCTIRAVTKWQ